MFHWESNLKTASSCDMWLGMATEAEKEAEEALRQVFLMSRMDGTVEKRNNLSMRRQERLAFADFCRNRVSGHEAYPVSKK